MTSMNPNDSSLRARTEVSSVMRKLGKDIKVRILPDAEAKNIKSGSATNIKVTKSIPANSRSWERNVPHSDGNLISSKKSSLPLPPARPASNSLPPAAPNPPQVPQTLRKPNEVPYQRSMLKQKFSEGVQDRVGNLGSHPKPQVPQTLRKPNEAPYQRSMLKRKFSEGVQDRRGNLCSPPKPQLHQTLRKPNESPYQRSMLKRKFSEGVQDPYQRPMLKQKFSERVQDRLGKSVVLQRKVSFEEGESAGLDLVSKELRRGKKCSGEVDFSSNPFSGSVCVATERLVSHHEVRDLKNRAHNMSLSMNKDTLHSGEMNSSAQARNLHAAKSSGAILPAEPSSTKTNVQERRVNKLKYIIHISPLNVPALQPTWKGNFEIPNLPFTNVVTYEGISAHPSAKVFRIAYEFSKQLPAAIHFTFHHQFHYLSETFLSRSPDRNDIALYFYPDKTDKSKDVNYIRLLKFLERKDMMLKSCMGGVNLLIFPSTILKTASYRKLCGSYFMWGIFCLNEVRSISGYATPASSTSVAGATVRGIDANDRHSS